MSIYLPIAEMSVQAEILMLLALLVGFLSGIFGVGGGFIMTPFLLFLGLPASVVVGTQANQLVAASVTGVLGHWRKGNVDVQIGGLMLAGSIFGSLIGVFLFSLLKYIGQIDLVISLAYVVMLGIIGMMMMVESLRSAFFKGRSDKQGGAKKRSRFDRWIAALPYKKRFRKSKIYTSIFVPAGIGFLGGLLVSIMGVGGGFILVPAMIYILGMSPLLVAGTSLFQIIFTTAFTTILHAAANQAVDLVLAFILIIGAVIGAQFGVRAARHIKGVYARMALSFMLLLVATRLGIDLVLPPEQIYSLAVRREG